MHVKSKSLKSIFATAGRRYVMKRRAVGGGRRRKRAALQARRSPVSCGSNAPTFPAQAGQIEWRVRGAWTYREWLEALSLRTVTIRPEPGGSVGSPLHSSRTKIGVAGVVRTFLRR